MLGTFQQTHLRIELEASAEAIGDSLLRPSKLRQWLWTQNFPDGLPEKLHPGLTFTSSIGLVTIQHRVDIVDSTCLRLILSQGIDGYHEWMWGDSWVQSRLEGISLLPLNLGQTFSLLSLRQFLGVKNARSPN